MIFRIKVLLFCTLSLVLHAQDECVIDSYNLADQIESSLFLDFGGTSFESTKSFKDQCRDQASKHPTNIKLNCEHLSQLNTFIVSKKKLLESAAIFSELHEIKQILLAKGESRSAEEKINCQKVLEKVDHESCSEMRSKFDEIEPSTYMNSPLYPKYLSDSIQDQTEQSSEEETEEQSQQQSSEETAENDPPTATSSTSSTSSQPSRNPNDPFKTLINQARYLSLVAEQSVRRASEEGASHQLAVKKEIHQFLRQNVIQMVKIQELKSKNVAPLCKRVLKSVTEICSNKKRKSHFSTDNEAFRKFFTKEFAKTFTSNPNWQLESLESLFHSVNYLICSQEKFDPKLVFGSQDPLTEISPKDAFVEKQCKLPKELIEFFGGIITSASSDLNLSEETIQSIDQKSEELTDYYINSDEGRETIAEAYKEAGLEPPDYTNNNTDPVAENANNQANSQGTAANDTIETSFGASTVDSVNAFSEFGSNDEELDQEREKVGKELEKKKEEAKSIEEQFARNIAEGQPADSEQNRKLIADLKRLEEEMKQLREENKRLAEQKEKREKDRLASQQADSRSSSTQSSSGRSQSEDPRGSSVSSITPSTTPVIPASGSNRSSSGSFSGPGTSSGSDSNTSGGENQLNGRGNGYYENLSLEESQKTAIKENGEILGEVFDRDREVKITFISVEDNEGYVITYRVETNKDGEESYIQVSSENAFQTILALSPKENTPARNPASLESAKENSEKQKTEKKPKESGMLDQLRNLLE